MREFNLTKKQKILCGMIPAVLLIFGALWQWAGESPEGRERQVVKTDNSIKIKPDAKILQTVFYAKCKDQEKSEAPPKAAEVGLDYTSFQALYPLWNIESFGADQIIMSLSKDDVCAEHAKNRFIGVQGDYIAVFYGKPGEKPALKELTGIAAQSLHPQALEEVKQGIAFGSNEEMLQILEGLHGR